MSLGKRSEDTSPEIPLRSRDREDKKGQVEEAEEQNCFPSLGVEEMSTGKVQGLLSRGVLSRLTSCDSSQDTGTGQVRMSRTEQRPGSGHRKALPEWKHCKSHLKGLQR